MGGGMHGDGGMCGEGGMHGKGGACVVKRGMHGERGHTWQRGEGDVCGKGGMHGGGEGACVAGETTTAGDGKHPVGMHPCPFYCHQNNGQNGSVPHSVRYSHHHHWYNAKR